MALSVKVGVQLKDVKNIKNEVQSKLDSISKQLKISPQKINLGNIDNLRTELQAKLDQVTKNLKLNLSGINISGVDTAKIKESLGDVKVKPKLDTGQIIADTNTLVSQIRSKVESTIGSGTIGKISINTGSNGEFLGAKVTAQLDNADTKVIKLNKDLEILGETFNQNSSKMANALASQNKYLDSQITKLKSYKQAVQGSGGGSVSKQMELNNALDVQIRKLEHLKSSNELLGNAEKARISETTNALKTQTSQLTRYDSSFKNTFGRMLQYFGSGSVIYGFVNQVKTGVNQIIELDDAMRDFRKVADATTEQLEGFTKVANGMAKEVGASTEGIVKSTELYSKLGYAMDEASERAKNANIFSNISDMDIDDATKALITIQKGFGMDSMEDMMTIMDATNEVGNKFSSSTQDIAEGLKEFSSTSLEAGNNLQESIGLFVSANASIQDSSRAGNALKTIIMRLRGMSTELDETGVPASKLRESIKAITASAGQMVDIMKDDNTFKSTTEILKELSEVYPKLTDAQKAWMQKNIAGVHQGKQYMNPLDVQKCAFETTLKPVNPKALFTTIRYEIWSYEC